MWMDSIPPSLSLFDHLIPSLGAFQLFFFAAYLLIRILVIAIFTANTESQPSNPSACR
jgi:hypothetical protein